MPQNELGQSQISLMDPLVLTQIIFSREIDTTSPTLNQYRNHSVARLNARRVARFQTYELPSADLPQRTVLFPTL